MRKNTIVMVGIAVVFGLLAVFVAQGWLNYQAELSRKTMAPAPQQVATRTIVVASAPMRFGTHVVPDSLREVSWPDAAIPAGTYSSIAELTAGGKRIVLASIERNEPILRTKITGPGQKATLSAVIQDGMRAVTVRTNDVEGVAGFVLPGDHVDVLLTRQSERSSGMNDVVIQNARVLAVDQLADDAADRPTVARAVTLEVDTVAAQKIALAASLGSLSLMLRRAGEQHMDATRRITASDLAQTEVVARSTDAKRFTKVSVTRAANKQEYNVPAEDSEWRDGAEAQAAAR
ncbi:MAG TPA: Flp pilus assembly protein CpaB, partial [Xanthobacteraceae bacterium]|nr:Flp pilus assembly protein CpaB [Xanthobacteraceae bacterium]